MVETITISSVAEILTQLKNDNMANFFDWPYPAKEREIHFRFQKKFGIWFRGQSDCRWTLTPSAFPRTAGGPYLEESASTSHFITRAASNPEYNYKSSFEWLCLMQHYNCPTRLLDWTENLLVALYFASAHADCSGEGKLYLLNAPKLNIVTRSFPPGRNGVCLPDSTEVALRSELTLSANLEDFTDLLSSISSRDLVGKAALIHDVRQGLIGKDSSRYAKRTSLEALRKPIAVLPARRHPRMILQQSGFTLHGGKHSVIAVTESERLPAPMSLEELNEQLDETKKFLYTFSIRNKTKIREELELMGIHNASLFPELEAQAELIRSRWLYPDVVNAPPEKAAHSEWSGKE